MPKAPYVYRVLHPFGLSLRLCFHTGIAAAAVLGASDVLVKIVAASHSTC
jgi:hypothetical protein